MNKKILPNGRRDWCKHSLTRAQTKSLRNYPLKRILAAICSVAKSLSLRSICKTSNKPLIIAVPSLHRNNQLHLSFSSPREQHYLSKIIITFLSLHRSNQLHLSFIYPRKQHCLPKICLRSSSRLMRYHNLPHWLRL